LTAPPRSEEWWPELGPKWRRTAATKSGFTVDIHAHVEIPESAEIAAPLFRPEHDPRLLYQPEESTRYNRELRATQQNDRIAQMVADRPDRFVGIANLPMDHPSSAVVELERAHHDLGFRGFEINADVNGGDLDDRRFDPVWEKAVELEMLAILHPHGFTHRSEWRSTTWPMLCVCPSLPPWPFHG